MRLSRRRALLVAALGTLLPLRMSAGEKLPDKLLQLPIDGVMLAADGAGRIVSFDPPAGRLVLWNKRGEREKTCELDASERHFNNGAPIGLSESHVLLSSFGDDKSGLVSYDMGGCRVVASSGIAPFIVFGIAPARYGWLLQATDLTKYESAYVLLDFNLKRHGEFSMPKDVIADAEKQSKLFGRTGTPFVLGGEVWLIPHLNYSFWRPRQKGKEEYTFLPPACLASEGREQSAEEVRIGARALAQRFAKDPVWGPVFQRRSEAADPGMSFKNAIQSVATYQDWVGVLIEARGSCRLDVWDLTSESAMAVLSLRDGCPRFFTFNDERVLFSGEKTVREVSFKEPLALPVKDPCEKVPKKTVARPTPPGAVSAAPHAVPADTPETPSAATPEHE